MGEFSLLHIVGVTGVLFGLFAFSMGQAIGESWRPAWQCIWYGLLLALGNRFIEFALFHGELLSIVQYLLDLAVIIVIALFAHRVTLARKMVAQYPWLYERSGLLSWRQRGTTDLPA